MPTPRSHGGAQIAHFPLTVPGFNGLNTQRQGAILGPEWATRLENAVIDSSGRVAARRGWESVTGTPHNQDFRSGIQYKTAAGTTEFVMTTDTKVMTSSDGNVWADDTGTAAFTAGHWYLVNHKDVVVGFQAGEKALVYNGTTSSQIADADAPTGGIGCSAFGRIWQTDSTGITLMYSTLLDYTNWATASAFDLSSIWPDNDTIQGVTGFNNQLIVFGKRNIIIFEDGSGSDIGLDPTAAVIVDTIPGVGLYSQFTIQHVNGDLWFLDNTRELRSIGRTVLEQKGGGITKLSANVSDHLRDSIDNGSFLAARIRSGFSARNRFYLLSLPTESNPGTSNDETGRCFVFDTRQLLEDGSARCVGTWNQLVPTVILPLENGDLYFALMAEEGELGNYTSGRDDGAAFSLNYESGWIDITRQGYILILKRINGLFFFDISTTVNIKWAFDFQTVFHTKELEFDIGGGIGLWGTSEWGLGEWGGGIDLLEKRTAGSGTGEYIKLGVEVGIDGGTFAIQQFDILAKVGRLKG